MRIYSEISLKDFEFWSGAKDRIQYLTEADCEIIEDTLKELYPEGLEEVKINDIFWFEEDFLAEILGYESFEEIMERNN